MADNQKTQLFEEMPIPKAVMQLSIPTVLSSLVMVIYNLADTYFVGMLNNPVQNAAVTLAAPVLLAFNAVNNLFGVGSSSMMSRALGRKDYDTVSRSSAFGFYCSLLSGFLFSFLCFALQNPLLTVLGADTNTAEATLGYLRWTVICGAAPAILNVVMAYMVRAEGASLHASLGTMSGCLLNIILDPIFILPWGLNMGAAGAGLATFLSNCVACCYFFILLYVRRKTTVVCISPQKIRLPKRNRTGNLRCRNPRLHPKSAQRNRYDHLKQLHLPLRPPCRSRHGHRPESKYGPPPGSHRIFPGCHAPDQLQLCQQQPKTHERFHHVHNQNHCPPDGSRPDPLHRRSRPHHQFLYEKCGCYRLRNTIPPRLLPLPSFPLHGFYRRRRIPGRRPRPLRTGICHPPQNRPRNTRPVHTELPLPTIRPPLCPVRRRTRPLHRISHHAQPHLQIRRNPRRGIVPCT